jgi:hypothetical protein
LSTIQPKNCAVNIRKDSFTYYWVAKKSSADLATNKWACIDQQTRLVSSKRKW